MNLSETSFVLESEVADFRCRYFTPAQEIPLAGHPTIATVHALRELGPDRARVAAGDDRAAGWGNQGGDAGRGHRFR